MSYADTVITDYEHAVDDEYERAVLHRSSTLNVRVSLYATLALMAVLAWVLPGPHSAWAFTLILPPIIGEAYSQRWMSTQVARPRIVRLRRADYVIIALVTLVAVAGFGYNYGMLSPEYSAGALIGALIGGVAAVFFVTKRANSRRKADSERLDAQLDD